MMQNALATNPRVASLKEEIRFTQYRLDITSDIGSRLSALARMRLLRDSHWAGAGADASNCAGSQAPQLGRNSAIGTGLTAC